LETTISAEAVKHNLLLRERMMFLKNDLHVLILMFGHIGIYENNKTGIFALKMKRVYHTNFFSM